VEISISVACGLGPGHMCAEVVIVRENGNEKEE